jgi:hypothetical protein
MYDISNKDIEKRASEVIEFSVLDEIQNRRNETKQKFQQYVNDKAPWYRTFIDQIDYSNTKVKNIKNERDIEDIFHDIKCKNEKETQKRVSDILSNNDPSYLSENVTKIVSSINHVARNDLIHYVALRRSVIDIFEKSLELNENGIYATEGEIHNIIFPKNKDIDNVDYKDHNLWLIDERLNFSYYLTSDQAINKESRPDLLIYDKPISFREGDENSNPITIFEFKRPNREDFINSSSKEDPINQIIRYAKALKDGECKTPKGKNIHINDNTRLYGYVICTISKKVADWLKRDKSFKPMPDGQGWYNWHEGLELYIEVFDWDKLIKDAKMRNKIFFHKLGIDN